MDLKNIYGAERHNVFDFETHMYIELNVYMNVYTIICTHNMHT